jgi:hypothetical protein
MCILEVKNFLVEFKKRDFKITKNEFFPKDYKLAGVELLEKAL